MVCDEHRRRFQAFPAHRDAADLVQWLGANPAVIWEDKGEKRSGDFSKGRLRR
jgi:hypothetical protein